MVEFAIEIKEINAEQLEKILVENAKTMGINACIFDVFNMKGKEKDIDPPESGLYNNGEGYLRTKVILRRVGFSFAEINFSKKRITTGSLKVNMSIYQNQNVFDENELVEYFKKIEHLT